MDKTTRIFTQTGHNHLPYHLNPPFPRDQLEQIRLDLSNLKVTCVIRPLDRVITAYDLKTAEMITSGETQTTRERYFWERC